MSDTVNLSSEEVMLHSILYAKGHYMQDDKTLDGLRVLVGHYSCMEKKYITDDVLLEYSLMLLNRFKPDVNASQLVLKAFKEAWMWNRGKDKDTISKLDFVQAILSELRFIMVKDLPPLPVADPNIYPLREK